MNCERCGTEIDRDNWCKEHCHGITDRIRAKRQAFRLSATGHPCNLCGLSCELDPPPWDEPGGLIDAAVVGGYPSTPGNGSGALDDGTGYRFSLCEFCLDWLFSRFKIRVATFDPMSDFVQQEGETIDDAMKRTGGWVQLGVGPPPEPWRPAEQRVKEDAWREDKEGFFGEKERRDAARIQSTRKVASSDHPARHLHPYAHVNVRADSVVVTLSWFDTETRSSIVVLPFSIFPLAEPTDTKALSLFWENMPERKEKP